MIPGASMGTERIFRPLSSVVCRIGNGKTFSSPRPGAGDTARPSSTIGNILAIRLIIAGSVMRGRATRLGIVSDRHERDGEGASHTPDIPRGSARVERPRRPVLADLHGESRAVGRDRDMDELAARRVAVG